MRFFLSLAIAFFWSNATFAADTKISALVQLSQASWAANDLFAIVDTSVSTTKKTTVADFDGRYVLGSDHTTDLAGKEPTITVGTSAQYWRGDKTFQTLDKTAVGLSNVDNTSDANKPVSTATSTALGGKEPTLTAGTSAQYYRGDKTWQTLDKTAAGLGNVDNTSDANKPVSTATQTALDKIVGIHPSYGVSISDNWLGSTAAGQLGWATFNNSGTVGGNVTAGDSTHMGITRLDTSTSATAAPTISLGSGTSLILGGSTITVEILVNISTLSTVTEEFIFRGGLLSGTTGTLGSHNVYFEYDRLTSVNWLLKTTAGGSGTTTTSSTAVSTGWHVLKIVITNSTLATYYVDGVSIGTVAATIPSGNTQATSPAFQMVKSAGTTARLAFLDWFHLDIAY